MLLTMTDTEKAFLAQRANFLRSEMSQEKVFERSLGIVGRWDARRMEKEIQTIVEQIACKEIEMARDGLDTTLIGNYVTVQKEKAMQYIIPMRCFSCRGNGHENDKMVRTCGAIDQPSQTQHWHHGSCLRTNFVLASKDDSRMPPTCACGKALPDAYAYEVLSDTEFRAYRNKREEINTDKRIYCPAPTCSYFISPRLVEQAIDDRVAELNRMARRPNKFVSGSFRCPHCKASICLICKGLDHPGTDCP